CAGSERSTRQANDRTRAPDRCVGMARAAIWWMGPLTGSWRHRQALLTSSAIGAHLTWGHGMPLPALGAPHVLLGARACWLRYHRVPDQTELGVLVDCGCGRLSTGRIRLQLRP